MVCSVYWSDWLSCWELLLLDWEAMRANVFQNEVSLPDWSLQEDRKDVKITKERKGGEKEGGGEGLGAEILLESHFGTQKAQIAFLGSE